MSATKWAQTLYVGVDLLSLYLVPCPALPGATPTANGPVGRPWEPLLNMFAAGSPRLPAVPGVTRGVRGRVAPCRRPPLGARTRRRHALGVVGKLCPSSDPPNLPWSRSESRKVTVGSVELRTN